MRPEIALAASFVAAQRKLGPAQLAATSSALQKLLEGGPEQVRLHALPPLPYEAFDVTSGALRVICHRDGDALVLLHVDTHDEAYAWARRRKVVRVGNILWVKRIQLEEEAPADDAASPRESAEAGPLVGIRSRELARFGFDPPVADFLRRIPDLDALVGLAEHLRPRLGSALLSLGLEPDRLDAIHREFEAGAEEEQKDLAQALRDPRNAEHFWVPRPGEEDLARALSGHFDTWQLFLHPSQHRVARMRASGPVKLTGGPGTGKTVVALHRARFLAEEVFADDERPILLTAFSRSLVAELERGFRQLVQDRPALAARIRCRTASQVAREVLEAAGRPATLLTGEALEEAWARALEADTLGLGRAFYEAEREEVIMARAAFIEATYLRVPRPGRGHRLGGKERKQVFAVLERFERALDAQGGADDAGLARRALDGVPDPSPYAAVVLDELQDAHPASLRLFSALAGDGPDRLFMAGDGYQRIFRRPIPLSWTGISVVGRSRHLRLNYRTTSGIRDAAIAVMAGQTDDPLDGDGENRPTRDVGPAAGRSMRPGPPPARIEVADRAAAIERMAALLEEDDAPSHRSLVLVPSRAELEAISQALSARGIAHQRLHAAEVPFAPEGPPVGLCTFHRAKGLEAAHVIIWNAAGPRRPAGMEPDEWARRQRSLRYVALTRARDRCTLLTPPGR